MYRLFPLSTRCIAVRATNNTKLPTICLPFLPKCYIYGDENIELLSTKITILDTALEESGVDEYCHNVLIAYVCNYASPGCNITNGEPQGICKEDCVTISSGQCADLFKQLPQILAFEGFVFDSQCENTLSTLQTVYNQTFTHNSQDCVSVSGKHNSYLIK